MLFRTTARNSITKRSTINLGGELISLASPQVMGILNVTPDSFYDGGRYLTEAEMVDRAREIVEQGGSVHRYWWLLYPSGCRSGRCCRRVEAAAACCHSYSERISGCSAFGR
jgi:Dihydropteroate synthase (EC 2.5.1.15)